MEEEQKSDSELIVSLVPYKIFPARSGGQKAIASFTEYLAGKMPLTCITVKSNDPAATDTYKILNILSDSPVRYANPFYFFTIRKYLRKMNATHLIVEHPYYGWLAALLKWFTPVKLVVRSHNIESLRWKDLNKWWWRILFYYEKWTHRRANYNLFITEEDRSYAIKYFHLKPGRCMTATFGIALKKAPPAMELQEASALLRHRYNIEENTAILLFNGIFSYPPNAEALELLINKINPLLIKASFNYRLIICGRDIPERICSFPPDNTVVAGFVDDMPLYLKGADVFLNPIFTGGGIKTKLVEALAFNLSCVSFGSGATGIPLPLTGSKLLLTDENDLPGFIKGVEMAIRTKDHKIPVSFFEYFNWEAIASKVEKFINS